MKAVLIPIKDPARGKTRLAGLLSADERRRLAWAMFEDVSRAVAAATSYDSVFAVTSFSTAADRARELGWDVLVEQEQVSESASVDWASAALAERGFDAVMRLPADVPLVKAEDIDNLFAVELDAPAALLVPSREGTGTNAIIRTPANLFPSRFGPLSLSLHTEEAARAGARCVIVDNPRIALDVDEPRDLCALLESDGEAATRSLLEDLNIRERLGRLRI